MTTAGTVDVDVDVDVDVAVVGAGITGLICAQRLQRAGYRVVVLEKSRGLGGRLATRRVEGVAIDHGARFLQPQTPALQALVDDLSDRGVLQPWQPQGFQVQASGDWTPAPPDGPYWVAPEGLSAVGKALGEGLTIHRQQRVSAISLGGDRTWTVTAIAPSGSTPLTHRANGLVLAIPAPQALDLLTPLAEADGEHPLRGPVAALAAVQYDPCITVMAEYEPPAVAPGGPLGLDAPWMVWGQPQSDWLWLGLDSSKRSAPTGRVVLQSSAAFAAQWIDAPEVQPAGAALLAQAATQFVPWLGQPQRWQVHRWRYALVRRPIAPGAPLVSPHPAPLVLGGDWCGTQQVDSALAAGRAAATAMARTLDGRSLPTFAPWL
jgi:predicted NAD/FAD-dependent oxidoreductase